jgi:hypothetical protein
MCSVSGRKSIEIDGIMGYHGNYLYSDTGVEIILFRKFKQVHERIEVINVVQKV